jgi:hypothetical protein
MEPTTSVALKKVYLQQLLYRPPKIRLFQQLLYSRPISFCICHHRAHARACRWRWYRRHRRRRPRRHGGGPPRWRRHLTHQWRWAQRTRWGWAYEAAFVGIRLDHHARDGDALTGVKDPFSFLCSCFSLFSRTSSHDGPFSLSSSVSPFSLPSPASSSLFSAQACTWRATTIQGGEMIRRKGHSDSLLPFSVLKYVAFSRCYSDTSARFSICGMGFGGCWTHNSPISPKLDQFFSIYGMRFWGCWTQP